MQTEKKTQKRSPRLKAGMVIVILTILIRFGLPSLLPELAAMGVLGGLLGGFVFLLWWAFFSRAPLRERWISPVLMIILMIAFFPLIHESISTAMQGMMYPSFVIPTVVLFFMTGAVAARRLSGRTRWFILTGSIVLACGLWTLVRSEGISGNAAAHFSWRWSETSEERLLASTSLRTAGLAMDETLMDTEAEWPGFRGPGRDGKVYGTSISSDWGLSPPEELWRRSIGPGCSSFAVHGNLLFTQEQRGEEEIVSCYRLNTGEPVWMHQDKARFEDSHAGAGPRSTPTISGGRIYTCGATGILNVLNEMDGSVIWSANAADALGAEPPGWGFTGSPLVINDVVVVAIKGTLVAYDIHSGQHLWTGKDGGSGYSSPHFFTIGGMDQILLMNESGVLSVLPEDGSLLWEYAWPFEDRILQPARLSNGDILLSSGTSNGLRRLKITREQAKWTIEEQWSASLLKSTFNDLVVLGNHAYGFSGPFLECVDMETGTRTWKGGRYGGQLILLADQALLLVLSEKGEIVLINAIPDSYVELARLPVIEGKTWNHPVLVGDILLVRNSQEMAAFRL